METKDGGRGDPDETSQRVPAGNYTFVSQHHSYFPLVTRDTHTFLTYFTFYLTFNLSWRVVTNTHSHLQGSKPFELDRKTKREVKMYYKFQRQRQNDFQKCIKVHIRFYSVLSVVSSWFITVSGREIQCHLSTLIFCLITVHTTVYRYSPCVDWFSSLF